MLREVPLAIRYGGKDIPVRQRRRVLPPGRTQQRIAAHEGIVDREQIAPQLRPWNTVADGGYLARCHTYLQGAVLG